MAETISCPHCGQVTSKYGITCRTCWNPISNIPDSLTRQLIESLRDEDLPDVIYQFVIRSLKQSEATAVLQESEKQRVSRLPWGQQAAYRLVLLDSEVRNGGFYQWLTNSWREYRHETFQDLEEIGAQSHVELVRRVLEIDAEIGREFPPYNIERFEAVASSCDTTSREYWKHFHEVVETKYLPDLDALDLTFYDLEDTDSLWKRFTALVRSDPTIVVCRAPEQPEATDE